MSLRCCLAMRAVLLPLVVPIARFPGSWDAVRCAAASGARRAAPAAPHAGCHSLRMGGAVGWKAIAATMLAALPSCTRVAAIHLALVVALVEDGVRCLHRAGTPFMRAFALTRHR